MRTRIKDPTQIIHPTYEEWLGTIGEAGDGVTACRICGNELTAEECADEEAVDCRGYRICYTCQSEYFVGHIGLRI